MKPEWLHFREPDGSITSKRLLDCTLREIVRFAQQMREEGTSQVARGKELLRVVECEQRGEVPTGTAAKYADKIASIDNESELLYGDFVRSADR